jgi:CheY-like chemotaxis protein
MTLRAGSATVLVIDDDPETREMYRLVLAAEGLEVLTARDRAEGLERARAGRPDVIVTDLFDDSPDRFDLVRAVRADPDLAGIAVIVLTGWTMPVWQHAARELDCAAFLTKPCPPDDLIRHVRRALGPDAAAGRTASLPN